MPTAIVPGIYDPSIADDNLWIETEDAYRMTRWLGRNEGLLVGMSSGANVYAATQRGKEHRRKRRHWSGRDDPCRWRDQISERVILE